MAFRSVFFSNKDTVFICICCQSLEFSKYLKIFGATNISLSLSPSVSKSFSSALEDSMEP